MHDSLSITNRDNGKYVMLSSNSGSPYYKRDVMVLWVNGSAKNHHRWHINALQFALTHAKHAIFIIGSTHMFKVCQYFWRMFFVTITNLVIFHGALFCISWFRVVIFHSNLRCHFSLSFLISYRRIEFGKSYYNMQKIFEWYTIWTIQTLMQTRRNL